MHSIKVIISSPGLWREPLDENVAFLSGLEKYVRAQYPEVELIEVWRGDDLIVRFEKEKE